VPQTILQSRPPREALPQGVIDSVTGQAGYEVRKTRNGLALRYRETRKPAKEAQHHGCFDILEIFLPQDTVAMCRQNRRDDRPCIAQDELQRPMPLCIVTGVDQGSKRRIIRSPELFSISVVQRLQCATSAGRVSRSYGTLNPLLPEIEQKIPRLKRTFDYSAGHIGSTCS